MLPVLRPCRLVIVFAEPAPFRFARDCVPHRDSGESASSCQPSHHRGRQFEGPRPLPP